VERGYPSNLRSLANLIGNTPLLAIDFTFRVRRRTVYAKAEHLNMTGSIKDRMAFHIIEQGYRDGVLKPGNPILEATSGNTGISFAAIGRALGHPVTIFMLDRIVSVDDGDAILMAQRLAGEVGLGVGISSGANFLGAVQVQDELGVEAVVVTVLPDDNKKYLSTDLLREEPVGSGFLAPEINLLGFRAFKRVCYTRCNPQECMADAPPNITDEAWLPHCPRRR
jgi:cysteine synthase